MRRRCWARLLLVLCAFYALPAAARAGDNEPSANGSTGNFDPNEVQSLPPASSSKPAWDDAPPAANDESDDAEAEEQEPSESDAAKHEEAAEPGNPVSELSKQDFERSLSGALSDPSASFCQAKELDRFGDQLVCSLSKVEVRQRCPGLQMACQVEDVERS